MPSACLLVGILFASPAPHRDGTGDTPRATTPVPDDTLDGAVTPWLVIGETVNATRILHPGVGGAGGTVLRTWDPPSNQDLELYLKAVGAALGIDPVLRAAGEPLMIEFNAKLDSIDSKRLPELFDLSEASHPSRVPSDSTRGAVLVQLHHAASAFLKERAEAESQFLDGVDRLIEEIGFPTNEKSRAVRKSYEDARWRARGAQTAHLVVSARCDLGLVAVEVCGGPSSATLDGARTVIQEYWGALTPPSKSYVDLQLRLAPQVSDILDRMQRSSDSAESAALTVERATLSRRIATPLFRRASINLEWRSRIADSLPEPQRSSFFVNANARMFPNVPNINTEGRIALQAALAIVESEPHRVQALQDLQRRHDEEAKEIIAKLEEVAINEHGAMYGLLDSGRAHWQGEHENLIRSLRELGDRTRADVRRHLSMQQLELLEAVAPARSLSDNDVRRSPTP